MYIGLSRSIWVAYRGIKRLQNSDAITLHGQTKGLRIHINGIPLQNKPVTAYAH